LLPSERVSFHMLIMSVCVVCVAIVPRGVGKVVKQIGREVGR